MPDVSTGLGENDPTVVTAFHAALVRQAVIVLGIVFLVAVAWNVLRIVKERRASNAGMQGWRSELQGLGPEARARTLLRVSFGLLWLFDGLLETQSSMPLGTAQGVIRPAAASSPAWVQHIASAASTIWNNHPVAVPAAAVWIQIGIGVWLLVAPRGPLSRLAGVSSALWGLVVWAFGEAFGHVLAPGLTWLVGAPGAVVFYCVAGLLVALPERMWRTPQLGAFLLRGMGLFFVGMALLQAWPGRGFWQGRPDAHAAPGTLASLVRQRAQIPQPHLIASWVGAFADFDAAHGWGVNLFAVIALASIGIAFITARPRFVLAGISAGVVLCLADWVLVEDLGFMGGVGTDPNSMIPMVFLFVAGYVALTRVPTADPHVVEMPAPARALGSLRERVVAQLPVTFRPLAAMGAIGISLVGLVPMARAAANPTADAILTQAINGPPQVEDAPAPGFQLTDQFGRRVSLASLRGKVVAMTLLDDVCTTDCPIIAQEFRQADELLGRRASGVEMVAINGNPRFVETEYLRAFDTQERLTSIPNWLYLTGSLPALTKVWKDYGWEARLSPGGAMVDHNEFAIVIDASGHLRVLLNADPGPASQFTRLSFSGLLAASIRQLLPGG